LPRPEIEPKPMDPNSLTEREYLRQFASAEHLLVLLAALTTGLRRWGNDQPRIAGQSHSRILHPQPERVSRMVDDYLLEIGVACRTR
jgi:hypothetical protein